MRKITIICNDLSIKVGIYYLKSMFFCRYATMLVTVTAQMDSDAYKPDPGGKVDSGMGYTIESKPANKESLTIQ